MEDVKKYLEAGYNNTIDYSRFANNGEMDDKKTLINIQKFINDHVKDILLIKIDEDKLFLTKKEAEKLPSAVRHYLHFSENRGIKMYVLNTKDGGFRFVIGVFGGSTGRANERYFDKIINDEKYKNIINIVSVKLTELLAQK